jgi:hypothetical protein
MRRATTVSRFGKRLCAFVIAMGVMAAAIAEQLRGVGHSAAAQPSLFGFVRPSELHCRLVSFAAFALLGVGHKKESLSDVVGTNRGSGETRPLRIVPERGQVSQNSSEESASTSTSSGVMAAEDAGDVLTHHPAGPSLANEAGELMPEVAVVFAVLARPGDTVRLAGPASGDDINSNSVSGQSVAAEGAYVVILFDSWPVFF